MELSSSMLRQAMRTLRSEQVARAGIVSKITTWVRRTPERLSWVHEDPTSHRLASSNNIKTNRWWEVSLKIRYLPLRKEFLQLKMPLASQSCFQRAVQWGQQVITHRSNRSCQFWVTPKKVLVTPLTSSQRPKEIRFSQYKLITSSVHDLIFIRRLISLDLGAPTTWLQPKATHLLSQILCTKPVTINRLLKFTSMASFKSLAKNDSVRNF